MTWLPIRYVDFYDIPRMIVVKYLDDLYLFDCTFDAQREDYTDYFTIYRLPSQLLEQLDTMPWKDLPSIGEAVGRVPLSSVRLDPSRRRYIDGRIFDALGLDPYSEQNDPMLVRLERRFGGY